LARRDLTALIADARAAGLYTNLLTSGIGLDHTRAQELREAGLDSLQLSFQADTAELGDSIAGIAAHERKLAAANCTRAAGIALSMNVVLHRTNIDRLPRIISLAEEVGAVRLELASAQYYGWAWKNRAHLLPTREQAVSARDTAQEAKERLRDRMEIFYVLPDYYEDRPKACMQGWGRRYLTVNPVGEVLPCPTAFSIPGLRFENVREHALAWIWRESASFNQYRGTSWMEEPCARCPRREIDFGGCRCQAALLVGDPAATDPVCTLSPHRRVIDEILSNASAAPNANAAWAARRGPASTLARTCE
jgi:pyrroloquinoline quinone biosynthesis protein E